MTENIDDRSRPRIFLHCAHIAICIGLGLGLLVIFRGESFLANSIMAMVIWLFFAAICRSVHALFFQPRFVLSDEGIRLRFWPEHKTYFGFDLLLPWLGAIELTIPWHDYTGCQVFTEQSERYGRWETLNIESTLGSFSVGYSIFFASALELMGAIRQYQELELKERARRESRFEEFQRARFVSPLKLVSKVGWIDPSLGCFWIPILGVFAFVGFNLFMFANQAGKQVEFLAGIGTLAIVFFLLTKAYQERRTVCYTNILECRAEGLALGKSEDELKLVPWNNVLYCRFLEKTVSQHERKTSSSVDLELNLRNVIPVIVESSHQRTPQEICDLITPSYEAVNEAWRRMSKFGEDARTAAIAVGIQKIDS